MFNAADVATGATFTALDGLVGGTGNDTLNITAELAVDNPAGSSVSGIETANVTSNDDIDLDTTTWTGLTALNTDASTATKTTTLTAAATTDVTAVAAGVTSITGGLNVTATVDGDLTVDAAAGAIDATVAGGDLTVIDAVGAVDATVTAQANNDIVIDGGTTVNVTATGVVATTGGKITIGNTDEPTGAVVVTAAGNYTSGADSALGAITINSAGASVSVTQSAGITAAETAAAAILTTAGVNSTVTQGAVTVTGGAATTSVSVTQQAAQAEADATGALGVNEDGVIGVANGAVTIVDATGAEPEDPDTITTVTLANYDNSTIESSALSTLNLTGGAVASGTLALDIQSTEPGATTLALNLNGGSFGAISGSQADLYETVNVTTATAASTVANLDFDDAATAVTISGTANLTVTLHDFADDAVITSGSTGNVTLGTAIEVDQQYVGGAGVDTISFDATGTTASTLGAGNDVATFAGVAGDGGSVDGGAGDDTVSLTAALAASLSAATDFEADISGFERLSLGLTGAVTAVNLANLDDINHVTSAGTGAGDTLAVSGFSSGGTFVQTAALNATGAATLTGTATSFTGATTFNIAATSAAGFTNAGTLTIGGVETIGITLTDTSATSVNVYNLNLVAANATTVTVSGNAGIDFAANSLAALTKLDASGVTEDGVVTFTANTAIDTTIIGGAGDDLLTGSTGVDTITGGAGGDTLDGDAGNDTINGGDGDDTITGGAGKDTLTGGDGIDTFVFAAGDSSTATPDVITDFSAEDDIIQLGVIAAGVNSITVGLGSLVAGTGTGVNVEVDDDGKVTFAANDDTLAEKLIALAAETALLGDIADDTAVFFEDGGNTYIFINNATGADDLIQLTGVTGLTTMTAGATVLSDNFSFA